MRPFERSVVAWTVALALLLAAPPLPAQSPEETATALVQEVFAHLRDDALVAPDGATVLRAALATVQQALGGTGASPEVPAVPVLTGQEEEDLRAIGAYIQAAGRAAPGRGEFIIASALRGMVRAAGDPLGAVFTPVDLARYLADLRGEHGTIGVQVDAIDSAMLIAEVIEGSPAARAGLRTGDHLLEVDSSPVAGRTPDAVLDLLRGRPGSSVSVALRRAAGPVQRLSVIREQVREIPVRARILEPRVGYLRLLEFTERAHEDVGRALARLTGEGAQALVLDLRENGGGLVDEAVEIASMFLDRGVVAVEEARRGQITLIVRPSTQRFTGPVIVLVNGGTASSSEIVAGALQDAGITLVGQRTFGKATVQTIYFLDAGWGLRITTARYRTRAGRAVEGVGLAPDVPVITPRDQVQGPGDTQFEIARLLARRRLESIGQPATARP